MALASALLKAPIIVYRYTLSAFIGRHCRHLPTCSAYALEAIDRHGAWRGFRLAASRVARCHPWGTHGFDPVPDLDDETRPCRMTYPWWRIWRNGGRRKRDTSGPGGS
jgi:uncharacterized protein